MGLFLILSYTGLAENDFILIIYLSLVVIIGHFCFKTSKKNNYSGQLKENISKISDFSATHLHISPDTVKAIAIDAKQQKVGLFKIRNNIFYKSLYHFTDIIEVAMLEDDEVESITSTSRASQVAGAAVGGLLLGGVGVVIGGLSGKKKTVTEEFVTTISLRIVFDDLVNPIFNINFFEGKIYKDGDRHKSIKSKLVKWDGILTILLRRSEHLSKEQFVKEQDFAKQISRDNPTEPDSTLIKEEITALVREGKKHDAIRLYLEENNVSLKEANDYIKSL